MPVPQQKQREIIFQMLYSFDLAQGDEEAVLPLLMKELAVTKRVVREAQERVHAIQEKSVTIDALIAGTSQSYDFARIQKIERNILRLALFELLYDPSIPPKVAIAEAIRLARKFGTPEAANFINAILDTIYHRDLGEEVNEEGISRAVESLIESEEIAHEASQAPKEPESTDEPSP